MTRRFWSRTRGLATITLIILAAVSCNSSEDLGNVQENQEREAQPEERQGNLNQPKETESEETTEAADRETPTEIEIEARMTNATEWEQEKRPTKIATVAAKGTKRLPELEATKTIRSEEEKPTQELEETPSILVVEIKSIPQEAAVAGVLRPKEMIRMWPTQWSEDTQSSGLLEPDGFGEYLNTKAADLSKVERVEYWQEQGNAGKAVTLWGKFDQEEIEKAKIKFAGESSYYGMPVITLESAERPRPQAVWYEDGVLIIGNATGVRITLDVLKRRKKKLEGEEAELLVRGQKYQTAEICIRGKEGKKRGNCELEETDWLGNPQKKQGTITTVVTGVSAKKAEGIKFWFATKYADARDAERESIIMEQELNLLEALTGIKGEARLEERMLGLELTITEQNLLTRVPWGEGNQQ